MLESSVHKLEQRSIALTIAVYAGLFTLALVMLALFHAAHDRAFLSFFAFSISALLMLAALNGHLYLLPGFRALGAWREQGICVLLLLFSASALYVLARYADVQPASRMAKFTRLGYIGLLALSAVASMGLQPLRDTEVGLTLAGWIGASIGCIGIAIDAARRRVRMAPGATSDTARQLGEATRKAVETLQIDWDGMALTLTVSVGVATRWPHEQSHTAAIERADKALYAAKRSGRNRVQVAPAEFF